MGGLIFLLQNFVIMLYNINAEVNMSGRHMTALINGGNEL